jgi:hypothetical protein
MVAQADLAGAGRRRLDRLPLQDFGAAGAVKTDRMVHG